MVARADNNELRRLLHLNSPPTLVVTVFKIYKKYHNTIVAKIAMLEIRSFVDHKLTCDQAPLPLPPSEKKMTEARGGPDTITC